MVRLGGELPLAPQHPGQQRPGRSGQGHRPVPELQRHRRLGGGAFLVQPQQRSGGDVQRSFQIPRGSSGSQTGARLAPPHFEPVGAQQGALVEVLGQGGHRRSPTPFVPRMSGRCGGGQ